MLKGEVFDLSGSLLLLSDGSAVRSKLIVDTTGFESRLTRRLPAAGAPPAPAPGYQIAYGCHVVSSSTPLKRLSQGLKAL